MRDVVCRVDKRNVGERLGKVANQALSVRVVFLCEQADIVTEADEPLEQVLRVRGTSDQDIGVGEPKAAGEERPFAGRQAVLARSGVVA